MQTKSAIMIVPALVAVAVLVSTGAFAKRVSISGTWSRSQIKKDCDSVGGSYVDDGKNGYSCVSLGTDVTCTNRGKCTGWVPHQRNPPRTIGGILHPPSGVKTTGGDAPWTGGDHHPVKINGFKPPSGVKTMGGRETPVIEHVEAHHFGGGHK